MIDFYDILSGDLSIQVWNSLIRILDPLYPDIVVLCSGPSMFPVAEDTFRKPLQQFLSSLLDYVSNPQHHHTLPHILPDLPIQCNTKPIKITACALKRN